MRILYLPNSYSQQRQHEKKANIYPVRMAMEAEWYRKQGHFVQWGENKLSSTKYFDRVITEPENLPFLTLPKPDRLFTRAKEYTSGNYKYLPGTHILSASGCWWGKCSFCVESVPRPTYTLSACTEDSPQGERKSNLSLGTPYLVRPVEDVISEIEECKALGFKEVFDDSATFPTGRWLDEFLERTRRGKLGIRISCNLRIGDCDFDRFRLSGFRMVLFGIESANQKTLDKINKGVKSEDIIPTIKRASECGLEPHIAVMFGHPDEDDEDAERTLKLVHYLLRKGYAKTAQASFYCPQGVPGNQAHKKYIKKIYNAGFYPDFWFHKLRSIRCKEDLQYVWMGIKCALNLA
jgi:radical SAM superfamily enzyme YgiQ (UPF0313 family)